MLFESLAGFEERYEWNLVGHSGSRADHPFVDFGAPPRSFAARSAVIAQLYATAEYHLEHGLGGDNSVEAIERAVDAITARPDCDDYLVFCVSDADLGGFEITPDVIATALARGGGRVTAASVFIAEPEAAEWLAGSLPFGRGFVCLDPSTVPRLFAEIFARAMTT